MVLCFNNKIIILLCAGPFILKGNERSFGWIYVVKMRSIICRYFLVGRYFGLFTYKLLSCNLVFTGHCKCSMIKS